MVFYAPIIGEARHPCAREKRFDVVGDRPAVILLLGLILTIFSLLCRNSGHPKLIDRLNLVERENLSV